MQNSKLAFVFPGQGSQKIGMLAELAEAYPLVEQTFTEASDVLNYDLWKLVQQGTQEEINLTETTQPESERLGRVDFPLWARNTTTSMIGNRQENT